MPYRLRPRAVRDLTEIGDYIAAHDPAAAERLIERMIATFNVLADYPEIGKRRDEVAKGMRHLVVGPYLILYKAASFGVDIVRVVHGARRLKRLV